MMNSSSQTRLTKDACVAENVASSHICFAICSTSLFDVGRTRGMLSGTMQTFSASHLQGDCSRLNVASYLACRWSVWFWCSYAADQIASSYWSVVVEDASQNQFSAYGFVEAANQVWGVVVFFLPMDEYRYEVFASSKVMYWCSLVRC